MRTLLSTLWVAMLLLFACRAGAADTTNTPLSVFVLSAQKVEGGRLIDTPDFPKLGYIPAVPALVLTNLESVESKISIRGSVTIGKDGKETAKSSKLQTEIDIRMRAEDFKRFTAITDEARGRKVILMLGETPLIPADSIFKQSLSLSCGEKVDAKTIETELKKLTK